MLRRLTSKKYYRHTEVLKILSTAFRGTYDKETVDHAFDKLSTNCQLMNPTETRAEVKRVHERLVNTDNVIVAQKVKLWAGYLKNGFE